jgi:hypothetical protein
MRRDYMMDAILSGDMGKKEHGNKILKNVGKQLQSHKLNTRPSSNNSKDTR